MNRQPLIVVGASRGFGAATTKQLAADGHHVVAVARSADRLAALADSSDHIIPATGDGRDAELAVELLARHDPAAILIGGGATPHMAPLEDHTWETLSLNWENDVALVFTWLHTILNNPTDSLEHVVVLSSGAGLFGSPGSGGYAGSKATTRFLATSAADSAKRLGRDIKFTSVNPKLTSDTDTGKAAVAGYAVINGTDADAALAEPPLFTAEHAGRHLANVLTHPDDYPASQYLLAEDDLHQI